MKSIESQSWQNSSSKQEAKIGSNFGSGFRKADFNDAPF